MKIHRIGRFLLPIAAIGFLAATATVVRATPYASCITNNNGTIQFYLNESGGSVTITYEDGSTNPNFSPVVLGTGVNEPSGMYSFSLVGHTSYAIAVTKLGTGTASLEPNVIQSTNTSVGFTCLQGFGDSRGVAVNVNPASPFFGRIYISRGGSTNIYPNTPQFFDINADGSWITGPTGSVAGVTTWSTEAHAVSPDRISIASNDDLVVGDWSSANAGVWLVDPNLVTNELLLGPIGSVNGVGQGVHGEEVGRPVLLGNLTDPNGATLLTVDGNYEPTRLFNCIMVYSNITQSAVASGPGWQNGPNVVGPEVAVNATSAIGKDDYFYPGLFVATNGYIYSCEYRSGIGAGDPAGVQVYSISNLISGNPLLVTNQLWTSRYNGGNSDYFNTAASGGSACLPTDVAVTPDCKYLVAMGYDNHLTICSLTNGIPNVSTIYTIAPTSFGSSPGDGMDDEVAVDAADNIYVLSASQYGLQTWTLGQSFTATTYGNATGTTNFNLLSLLPTIGVYATNPPVISQANSHGNPTSGTFTIVRSGPSAAQLTVNFAYSGTAPGSTYTAGSTGSVILYPGQTTTNITITAVSDGIPRVTTYLTLTLSSSMNYIVSPPSATISILNTATPELIGGVAQSSMYNAFSNDFCSMTITRWGDTNTTETVNNFTTAGTAVEGTDYTTPTPVTFVPGDLTHTVYIYPLNSGQIPVHNPSLPYSGNKTVTLGIGSGSGYTAATNTAALTIVDSASPPATILFSDPLTNSVDPNNWEITAANGNLDNSSSADVDVQFGQNLDSTPFYPIPAPPSGASNALMITVNKSGGTDDYADNPMTAVNAYLTNSIFSGNYAVRFNMNVIQGDSTSLEGAQANGGELYDAEEGPLFGINHTGTQTNWWAGDTFTLGDSQTTFGADGIFYWISDNGGLYSDTFGPYLEFTGAGGQLPNTGWTNLAIAASSTFATQFKANVFTAYASANVSPYLGGWTKGGPGLPANGPETLGFSPQSWSDVEIKQLNGVVTMSIDKTTIFTYTNNTAFTNGYIMLGYEDPFDGGETVDTAVYYSNLRVVQLTPPVIKGPAFNAQTAKFTFEFTSPDDTATPASFAVTGATTVTGPYTTVAGAVITQLPASNGAFQATVPMSGPIHFYRVQQLR